MNSSKEYLKINSVNKDAHLTLNTYFEFKGEEEVNEQLNSTYFSISSISKEESKPDIFELPKFLLRKKSKSRSRSSSRSLDLNRSR